MEKQDACLIQSEEGHSLEEEIACDRPRLLGIIGCSKIVERAIVNPFKDVEGIEIYGIASRHEEKARSYAKTYGIPHVFPSYEVLLSSEQIDAVYIALPNALHYIWIMKALEAGKHVLIEKPIALHGQEVLKVEEKMKASGLHVIEGIMVQHHPWQLDLKERMYDYDLGKLLEVQTAICILPKGDKEKGYRADPTMGGGAWYDLSCYVLQFLQVLLGLEGTTCEGHVLAWEESGCDKSFQSKIIYQSGVTATCLCSHEGPYQSSHRLIFQHGSIEVRDFFRACVGHYKIKTRVYKGDQRIDMLTYDKQNYYTNQLDYFCRLLSGEVDAIPLKDSYQRVHMMEQIYQDAMTRKEMGDGEEPVHAS